MFGELARIAALAAVLMACGGSDVSRTLGARCDALDECDERCLSGADFPGGFCSISCDGAGDCPGSAECVDEEGGVCLFSCALPEDCDFLGLGWTCEAVDARGGGEVMACIGN